MSFSVRASLDRSSFAGGTGSRLPGVRAVIAAARRLIASTGRNAPTASAYPAPTASRSAARPPMTNSCTSRSSVRSRWSSDAAARVSPGRSGASRVSSGCATCRPRPRSSRSEAPGCRGAPRPDRARGGAGRPRARSTRRTAPLGLRSWRIARRRRRLRIEHALAVGDPRRRLGGLCPQILVDVPEQRVRDADVDEEPHRGQHERHHDGVRQGEPEADRQPAQPPPSSRNR